MKINVGLSGGMSIIPIGNRDEVKELIVKLILLLKKNNMGCEILEKRFYKKYISYVDIPKFQEELSMCRNYVNRELSHSQRDMFNKLLLAISKLREQADFLYSENEDPGVIKLIVSDLPYAISDTSKDNEFYDSLSEDDTPFWDREIISK